MSNFDTCVLTKSGNIILPRGRLIYPALFTPTLMKGETDESKAKYQASVLLPKSAKLDLLLSKVEEIIAENVSAEKRKTTKVKKPFLKTEDQPRFVDFAEDYPVMLRMNSKQRPDVVNAQANKIDDESEVYSGRWARISVRPFFYDHPTGGKGISLGLQNCQLLDHDEVLAGGRVRAEDEFEAVEGSTADSMFA